MSCGWALVGNAPAKTPFFFRHDATPSAGLRRLPLPARARARAAALRLPALRPMQACHGQARPRLHAPARAQAQQRTLSSCANMGASIGWHPLCSLGAAPIESRVPFSSPAKPLELIGRPEAHRAPSGALAPGISADFSVASANHLLSTLEHLGLRSET